LNLKFTELLQAAKGKSKVQCEIAEAKMVKTANVEEREKKA